ncbi:MAG: hypothetical protein ACP5I8_01365 [Phycisphaerae bacterium]
MHKKLRKALLYFILLIMVLIVAVWFSIDGMIRSEIQSRATAALGVKTMLADANLSILAGRITLTGLTVDNLKGYADPHLLTMQSCGAVVSLHSLLAKTVVVKIITINGLHISMDQNGLSNNLMDEINHLNKLQRSAASGNHPQGSGGKALTITKVLLLNTVVRLDTSLIPGQNGAPIVITLPRIVLIEPTNPNGRPLRLAGLMEQILVEIAKSVANNPAIPGPVRSTLDVAASLLGSGTNTLFHGLGQAVTGTVNSLGHLLGTGTQSINGDAK